MWSSDSSCWLIFGGTNWKLSASVKITNQFQCMAGLADLIILCCILRTSMSIFITQVWIHMHGCAWIKLICSTLKSFFATMKLVLCLPLEHSTRNSCHSIGNVYFLITTLRNLQLSTKVHMLCQCSCRHLGTNLWCTMHYPHVLPCYTDSWCSLLTSYYMVDTLLLDTASVVCAHMHEYTHTHTQT